MAVAIDAASTPPIRKSRFSISVPCSLAGVPTDPTATITAKFSIDGGQTFATAAETPLTGGTFGQALTTLTGAEMDASMVIAYVSGANSSLGKVIIYPQQLPIIGSGTLSVGSSGGGTLGTILTYSIIGAIIRTTGGTGGGGTGGAANQARRVVTYNVSTGAFTVSPNWSTTPSTDTTYDLLQTAECVVSIASNLMTFNGTAPGSAGSLMVTNTSNNFAGAVGSVTGSVGSVTGNLGGNVNGNVTGSVGSVVGAVGSVTGAVGSVTGSVGSVAGNVTGTVASVVGAVGSVTGAAGSVTGSVGSVAGDVSGKVLGGGAGAISGDGVRAASVTGAVGSVTGAVGSVTAAITLPTIPTNWITSSGINASALNGKGDWLLSSGYTAPDNTNIGVAASEATAAANNTTKIPFLIQGSGTSSQYTASALALAPTGGGGSGLPVGGPVTLAWLDANSNPIGPVAFAVVGQGVAWSAVDGTFSTTLSTGTYTVRTNPKNNVMFADATLTVSSGGTGSVTITGTSANIPDPPSDAFVTGYLYTMLNGIAKGSVVTTWTLTDAAPSILASNSRKPFTVISDAIKGLATNPMLKGIGATPCKYHVTTADGGDYYVNVSSTATSPFGIIEAFNQP